MYRAMFQNSKIALLFAVMTIISAVSMVGTSEDSGVVGQAVGLAQAAGENRQTLSGAAAGVSAAGTKSALPSVFGDYSSAQTNADAPRPISAEDLDAGNIVEPIK